MGGIDSGSQDELGLILGSSVLCISEPHCLVPLKKKNS